MDSLAIVLGMQGHYPESVAMSREAITLESRTRGDDYYGVLMARSNLADTLYLMGDYGEAKQQLQDILARQLRVIGATHPETARSYYNLGCIAARTGNADEALPLFAKAIEHLSPRNLPKLDNDPDLKPIQKDPRFGKLAARARQRGASEARCPL